MIETQKPKPMRNHGTNVRHLRYWKERLEGAKFEQYFDYEIYAPEVVSSEFRKVAIPGWTSSSLLTLTNSSQGQHIVFLTTVAILAAKYSRTKNVMMMVGLPSSSDEEHLFIPFRIPLDFESDFKQTITQIKEFYQQDRTHNSIPEEEILKLVEQKESPKIWVTLNQLHGDYIINLSPKDLHFHLGVTDTVKPQIHFNPKIYHLEYIKSLMMQFRDLWNTFLKNPGLSLKMPDLNHQQEVNVLEKQPDPMESLNIIELFQEQVAKTPDQLAVIDGNEQLTYLELDRKSNLLAKELIDNLGIKKGDRVALILDRNHYLIISILGVLKAGAAFVPIDAGYPKERVEQIILSASPAVVISEMYYSMEIGNLSIPTYIVDVQLVSEEVVEISPIFSASDLAYVLYTSGSTGRPKGVMISHGSLSNYINWAALTYAKGSKSNFALFTSIAFDLTITSLFCPIVTGSSIVVFGDEKTEHLIDHVFTDEKVNVVKLTPSHLYLVLEVPEDKLNHNITTLVVGGERLESELAERILELFKRDIKIYNEYGPTEATVGCMTHEFQPNSETLGVPIGRAIPNTNMVVLDDSMKPVPMGAKGQLYISGRNLAIGYFGDEELTQKVFIQQYPERDLKLYASGDVVRVLNDNCLEFIGRADDQVKIRGHRIELGEIAATLALIPSIDRAFVQVKGAGNHDQFLVAYVETKENLEIGQVKKYLSKTLPAYMIPETYVKMSSMPLTNNGKIDKVKLPEPLLSIEEINAPETDTQIILVRLWSDLLGWDTQKFSIDQDLFEIGANSISAFQAAIKIKKELSKPVEVSHLFDFKTIREQGNFIETLDAEGAWEIPVLGDQDRYITSPAQERMFFQYLLNPESLTYNVAGALRIKGDSDIFHIQTVIQKLIDRHPVLRTTYVQTPDGVCQEIGIDLTSLEIFDQDDKSLESSFLDFVRPHDLRKSPIRFGFYQRSKIEFVLFVDVHHIACDGYSLNILINDLKRLISDKTLSALPLRYVDYSSWQKNQLETVQKEKSYWTKILERRWPTLELNGVSGDEMSLWQASRLTLAVTCDESDRISTFIRKIDCTNFMFFLSIYYILLNKVTGSNDLIIGTDVIGRPHPDLDNVVGTFINILPLRLELDQAWSFKKLLSEVKNIVLDAVDHQSFQYDDMVEVINHQGNSDLLPIVKVHFAFDEFQREKTAFDVGGIEVIPLEIDRVETTQYEFKIDTRHELGQYWLDFVFSTSVFEEESIQVLLNYYDSIMREVIKQPTVALEDIKTN